MKDYLKFVWQSLTHPTTFVDLLASFQLVLFLLFLYYVIRIFVSIIKIKKS